MRSNAYLSLESAGETGEHIFFGGDGAARATITDSGNKLHAR